MSKYYYTLYGETLISEYKFIELLPTDSSQVSSNPINIHIGLPASAPKALTDTYNQRMHGAKLDRQTSWFTNQWGGFLIVNGQDIYADAFETANLKQLGVFILGYCIAFLFWQRGEYAFHCSAVYSPTLKGAILITGNSGAGKSTFTSKLISEGCVLMADDVSIIYSTNDGLFAKAAYPQQKICRDQVEKQSLDVNELRYIDENKDKFARLVSDFHSQTEQVRCIVFLSKNRGFSVKACEVTGLQKIRTIADNMFLSQAFSQEKVAASDIDMLKFLDFAAKSRIISISRPIGRDTVNEMYSAFNQALGE